MSNKIVALIVVLLLLPTQISYALSPYLSISSLQVSDFFKTTPIKDDDLIAIISKIFPGRNSIIFADLDTGNGNFGESLYSVLQPVFPEVRGVGIETDLQYVDFGSVSHTDIIQADSRIQGQYKEKGLTSGSIDIVTVNNPFPSRYRGLIREAVRLVKNDGVIFITVEEGNLQDSGALDLAIISELMQYDFEVISSEFPKGYPYSSAFHNSKVFLIARKKGNNSINSMIPTLLVKSSYPITESQKLTDAGIIIQYQGSSLDFSLPKANFGTKESHGQFDLIGELLSFSEEKLGYRPLLSLIGSFAYMRRSDGTVFWDAVTDIDIRIHTRGEFHLLREKQNEIILGFYEILKAQGINCRNTVTVDPEVKEEVEIYDQIADKYYPVQITFYSVKELFSPISIENKGMYQFRFSDFFFGDIDLLNEILLQNKHLLIKQAIDFQNIMLLTYEKEVGNFSSADKLKILKRLFNLALMSGQGDSFHWLIGDYMTLKRAFNMAAFEKSFRLAVELLELNTSKKRQKFTENILTTFVKGPGAAPRKLTIDAAFDGNPLGLSELQVDYVTMSI